MLFGAHGPHYKKPDQNAVNEFLTYPGISSIQITFHEDKAPELHSMPPGGFRLAVVNCWNLEIGLNVRERLAALFQKNATEDSTFNVQGPTWPALEL